MTLEEIRRMAPELRAERWISETIFDLANGSRS